MWPLDPKSSFFCQNWLNLIQNFRTLSKIKPYLSRIKPKFPHFSIFSGGCSMMFDVFSFEFGASIFHQLCHVFQLVDNRIHSNSRSGIKAKITIGTFRRVLVVLPQTICFVEWCGPIWELTISEKNSLQRRSLAIKDDIFFTFFDLIIPINWCHESLPQFEMQDVAHQSGNLQPGQKLATALLFLSRLVSQQHLFHHLRSNHTNELM